MEILESARYWKLELQGEKQIMLLNLLLCEIEGEIKRAVLLAADAYLLARGLLWENTARERKAGAFVIVFECCDRLGDYGSNI
ncbi:hypothetical protein OAE39_00200 [Akkermansiaceae bacterium]|nr:hypothetical protein [Akkermansiaceae bacterium]